MALRDAMFDLTQRILEIPLGAAGGFFGALFTLYQLIRFFRWVASHRGGADYDDLSSQAESYGRQIRTAPARARARRRP